MALLLPARGIPEPEPVEGLGWHASPGLKANERKPQAMRVSILKDKAIHSQPIATVLYKDIM